MLSLLHSRFHWPSAGVSFVRARTVSEAERSRLARKLESIGRLAEAERSALVQLPLELRELVKGDDVVREGERPPGCCLVLDGFICRYKLLSTGRRQILSFHAPGDIPDLQSLHLRRMDHSVGALAPSRVALVTHDSLRELIRRHPPIGDLFWRDTLIDAAIYREWMVGLGRRTAHGRIAHLLCEMLLRFKAVGLAQENAYPLPVTQEELGDALGLTVVHINRVLRSLREDGLVRADRGGVSILDWERLQVLAEFDPSYLHQDEDL